MIITWKQLKNWLDPWPIVFRGNPKFRAKLVTAKQLGKYKSCWGYQKRTLDEILRLIEEDDFRGKQHQIRSLARSAYEPRAIIIKDGIVWDGNHGALAMLLRKSKKLIMVLEACKK